MRGQIFLKIIASYIELILSYLFIKISIIVEQNLI